MRRVGTCILLLCWCASVGSVAYSQVQPAPRLSSIWRIGFGIADLPNWNALTLVEQKTVREQLGLNDEQVAKLKTLIAEAGKEFQAIEPEDAPITPEETELAHKIVGGYVRDLYDKSTGKLIGILSPEQLHRIEEIRLQASAPIVFTEAKVADALGLSTEQRKQMEELQKLIASQVPPTGSVLKTASGVVDFKAMQARREQFAATRKQSGDRMYEVLSPEQRQKWETLKGVDFEIATLSRPTLDGALLFPQTFIMSSSTGNLRDSLVSSVIRATGTSWHPVTVIDSATGRGELRLNADEAARIETFRGSIKSRLREIDPMTRFAPDRQSLVARSDAFSAAKPAIEAFFAKSGSELQKLLTPGQWQRLQEIILQGMCEQGKVTPDAIKPLALTAEQLNAVAQLNVESQTKRRAVTRERAAVGERYSSSPEINQKHSEAYLASLLAILNAEQKEKWPAVRGEPAKTQAIMSELFNPRTTASETR